MLIEKVNETIKTKGGLLMTGKGAADMRYGKGVVLSAGTAFVDIIPEGSTVYYDSSRAHDAMVGGQWVTVVRGTDIVMVDEKGTDTKED